MNGKVTILFLIQIIPYLLADLTNVTIPFQIEFEEKDEKPENIIQSLSNSLTIGEVKIGTPFQNLKMEIHNRNFYMFFYSCNLDNGRIKGFNPKESSTYEDTYRFEKDIFDLEDYIDDVAFYDVLSFSKERPLVFPLATKIDQLVSSKIKYGGKIGLDLSYGNYQTSNIYNLFTKIKPIGAVERYDFYFNFTSKYEGNLLVGVRPFDVNETLLQDNFATTKAVVVKDKYLHWAFSLDEFLFNGGLVNIHKDFKILLSFGEYILTAPEDYQKIFKENFFKKNKKCYEKEIDGYVYYYCNRNVDYSKIKKILFRISGDIRKTVFSFSGQELFYEKGNYIYFLIRFSKDTNVNYWKFGQLFLSKYIVSFNQDSKVMLLPINYEENEYDNNTDNKRQTKAVIITVIVMSIILVSVIIGFVIYLRVHRKRKIRARELEDNYDYETNLSNTKNINSDKLLN